MYARGAAQVDLVAQDEEGHIVQILAAEQLIQFFLGHIQM